MKINSKKSNPVKTAFCWAVGWIPVQTAWWVAHNSWMARAPLEALFRHFQVSKWGKSGLVGKVWMSTFQLKWNFWIWWSFAPPKLQSPKTAFCNSKMCRKSFFACFWLSGGLKLHKISSRSMSICKFLWKIWKCWVFAKWSCHDEGSRGGWDPLMGKTCKLLKNAKIHPKFSKFLGICVVARLFSALILEWSLNQDTEGIWPLSPF